MKRCIGGRLVKRAGIVLALLLPSIALAQRINLDDTPAPAAGSGLAALALADELEKEAAELGKGEATALGAARIAVRRLARDLLKAGEQDGATGSVRVLVGRTIAARRFGLDECLRAPGVDGPMLEALARDLAVPAGGFPADPAGLDRLLRDALAPLVQASVTQGAHGGWIGAEPEGAMEPPPPLGTVARVAGLAPEAVRVFEELDSRLNTAKGWVAYRPSALATERLVRRAMLVVEKNRPEWLGDEAQTRLRTDLLAAVGELAAGGDTVGAGASLRRLSAFAGAAGAAQRLDQGRGARALRAAIGEILTGPAWAGDPGLTARLHAMRRMLDLLADVPGPEDKAVVRQLRPALRALEPAARQSAAQLLETLPRLLKQPDALSDPAVLGAMTAHEHRVADVALIKEISGSMAETGASGEAVARGALKPLADRLLTLGQDLNKAETRDIALTELREVGRQLRDYKEMPGEKELRAGVQGAAPEWGAVGERITDLPAAIDQARAAWLAERTAPKGIPTPPKARRLAVLRAGVRALADGAGARRVIELGDSAALNAWPGWELSREALAVITGGLFDQTSKLVGQLVTGQDDEAEASISRITAQHGAALLMGRLEWRAEELGLRPQAFGAADALVQIALGPPDPDTAWLARVDMDLRSDLAAVCRYAEESALAQAKKDNAKAQVFRGYYNGRARAALERLESQNRP